MSTADATPLPRVAAILVVHEGERWLPGVLATLARVRYPALDVVAVDSGSSDGSAALLAAKLPADRIVTMERNQGFGRAVAAAVAGSDVVTDADMILLLHDDVLLAPNALARMVAALLEDDSVGIVGPKLRDWSGDRVLQEVGLTIDRLGRAESRLEPGELDQGQHDQQRPVLYVSTAGMLMRRDVLRRVGGFDARFPVFRDDLDFCWRAWLAGERVEVVPAAVGYHIAAASRRARQVGRGKAWEPRYFAERHTLATLLKNYSLLQLAWVLPVVVLFGLFKLIGFLATRRFSDAVATVRAWAWNLVQLPFTLRRRRQVQARRSVSDRDLLGLFAPGLPRARSYAEAVGSWLAGGSTRALMDEGEDRQAIDGGKSLGRRMIEHPAAAVGVVLGIAYLIGASRLLGGGQIVGGEIAPWPSSALGFLRAFVSPWNPDPLASGTFTSPIQAFLGLVGLLGFGSAWLAQRLVVLGLLPLAWVLAVRAGRLVTTRPGPRVLGATLYVISPVMLGTLADGRLGMLAVAALLPGLLLVGVRTMSVTADPAGSWRAMALFTLGLIVSVAAAPSLLPLLAVVYVSLLCVSLLRRREGRRQSTLRLLGAGALTLVVLSPWLYELVRGGWSGVVPPATAVDLPLWRALGIVPQALPGLGGPAAWVVAATSAAVVLAALLLGLRVRPAVVSGLVAVWVVASLAAWGLADYPLLGLWPYAPLVLAALAQAGLGILAARWLADSLGAYAFGARQVATVLATGLLVVGLAGGVLRIASGPWDGLRRDPELLPAFIGADAQLVGPYRVVLIEESEGIVRWDVTGSAGPQMLGFGTVPDPGLIGLLDTAIGDTVGGADPTGALRLGIANVRYVVIAEGAASPELVAAIDRQPGLEPHPTGGVEVWRVRTWLPRAGVLGPGPAAALLAGELVDTRGVEEGRLVRSRAGRFEGPNPHVEGGLLVVSEGSGSSWRASGDGRQLAPAPLEGVHAFTVEPGISRLTTAIAGGALHQLVVALQLLVVLGILSIALRPPGTRLRRETQAAAAAAAVPVSLSEDLTPPHGIVVPGAMRDGRRTLDGSQPEDDRAPAQGPDQEDGQRWNPFAGGLVQGTDETEGADEADEAEAEVEAGDGAGRPLGAPADTEPEGGR